MDTVCSIFFLALEYQDFAQNLHCGCQLFEENNWAIVKYMSGSVLCKIGIATCRLRLCLTYHLHDYHLHDSTSYVFLLWQAVSLCFSFFTGTE